MISCGPPAHDRDGRRDTSQVGAVVSSTARNLSAAAVVAALLAAGASDTTAAQDLRLCGNGPASAAAPATPQLRGVPGGDIFGFSSGTDIGTAGGCGLALEHSSRIGKRDGSYLAGTMKVQFSATLRDDLAVALSSFVTHHRIRDVQDLGDRSAARFDGLSFEVAHRVLERGTTSPLAATVALETRWSRIDGTSGEPILGYGTEFKLFVDMPVGERYAAAVNLNYAPGVSQDRAEGSRWSRASATNVSAAVARDMSSLIGPDDERFFAGLETRHLTAFDAFTPRRPNGQAVLAGPTLFYKLAGDLAVNFAWTPQLWGRVRDGSHTHDLENFERQQIRLKLVAGF